ncbi:MAG: hypothetical protein KA791_01790 [Flavobacteriales bacterium]|nr:hypothetical protein [Flavobacteriales bacterium]
MRTNLILSILVFVMAIACRHDAEEVVAPSGNLYFPRVKQIIQTRCTISCHAPSAGLPQGLPVILETDADIVLYATGIKAAVADPVSLSNHRMPPDGDTLNAQQIATIVEWWDLGGTTDVCPLNGP